MSATSNVKTVVDQALKRTANELRVAQQASNKAFNAARRGVSQLAAKIADTPDKTFRKPAARRKKKALGTPLPRAAAAAAPKPKRKPKAQKRSDDSDDSIDDSIFWAKTGMTPPHTSFKQTIQAMDAVSPGLSDGLDEESGAAHAKTPTNTPNSKPDDLVLVQAKPAAAAKKSPTKECPSCGAEIATACRTCPHCGASALRQDARSKKERKRRRERAEASPDKRQKKE